MVDLFKIIEEPSPSSQDLNIDPEKLKYVNTKLKTWDLASIFSADYQKLSTGDEHSILKNYYHEMSLKYSTWSGIYSFVWISLLSEHLNFRMSA